MSWRHSYKLFSTLILLVLVLSALPIAAAQQVGGTDKIEPLVLEELNSTGKTDYFIWMSEQADVSAAAQLETKLAKGTFVYQTLVATAGRTQKDLRAYLDRQGVSYKSFYIVNAVLVNGGSYALLMNLAARPDVARITANHKYQLQEPFKNPNAPAKTDAIEPNITFVKAPDVWALGITGQGTVVAGNDTGIQWDHPAIINHYRGWNGSSADHNYNWWDATGTYPAVPADGFGHGTHTTGTMVGDDGAGNQIGVAPGAKTIHCKNMTDGGSGDDNTFLTCFAWDLAPWDLNQQNPRPDLAPDAINNSWGYPGGGQPQLRTAILNLQAAGTLVEVSAGNEGPSCASLRTPGDYNEVLTTGSVNHANPYPGTLTGFSSRGPSALDPTPPNYFPDIMAPGESIRSSVPGSGYEGGWSGTSMAGPHATALVGLMWSACPTFKGRVNETLQIIKDTATPLTGEGGSNCGGDYTTGPNNDWGYGTIDDLAAVQAVIAQCGPTGSLEGHVTDANNSNPIPGAHVNAATTGGMAWNDTTDANGYYNFPIVPEGTYTVSASAYGYMPQTHYDVEVISGSVTTEDFSLQPVASYVVDGTVYDENTGWPLYARIDIQGYPNSPIWTDPVTGYYNVTLAGGMVYTFTVNAWVGGYLPSSAPVGPLSGPLTVDWPLAVDEQACSAPGYHPDYFWYQNFENGDGGFAASGTTSWAYGVPTSGPGEAHSPTHVWATNPGGDYNNSEDGYVTSPNIDLSTLAGQGVYFSWWQWLVSESGYDYASVQVSNDGGGTWTLVYGELSGSIDPAWANHFVILDPSYAVANFQVRFHFRSDTSVTYPGWYIDDIGINGVAPGTVVYNQDFEANDGGYVVAGNAPWEWGTPTSGPGNAHSGVNVWATNLAGDYDVNQDGTITSPAIDLSAYAGDTPTVKWWQWLQTESCCDYGRVEVSKDNGATWAAVYEGRGDADLNWARHTAILDPTYAVAGFRVRFNFHSDLSIVYPGWYVDDVVVEIGQGGSAVPCLPPADGSLVVGNVSDENTALALNGALVTNDVGGMATTVAVPEDPNNPGGFYTLYTPNSAGVQAMSPEVLARLQAAYNPQQVVSQDPSDVAPTGQPAAAPDLWGAGAPIPTGPRYRAAGTSCDGQTYYLFGGTDNVTYFNQAWRYDPATDVWTQLANMPVGLSNLQAACSNGFIYLVGGYTGSAHTNNFQIYDTVNNTWVLSTWPNARSPMLAAWNGKLYAFGGNPGPSAETWMYDPATALWTQQASMPTAATYGSAVTVGAYIFRIGGASASGGLTTVERYDPAANAWSTGGPQLQNMRMSPLSAWYGNFLYVASGGGNGGNIWTAWPTTEMYDPSLWPGGAWGYQGENVPTPVVAPAGDCATDQVWGAGGTNGSIYANNQYLDDGQTCHFGVAPQEHTFTATMDLYGPDVTSTIVPNFDTIRVDFQLPAGWLDFDPVSMHVTVSMGMSTSLPLDLLNLGGMPLSFELKEMDRGFEPTVQAQVPNPTGAVVNPPDTAPPSLGRAPNAPQYVPTTGMHILNPAPAYAMDVYPGYNLVSFDTGTPGTWNIIANEPGSSFFGGTFLGGDFSKLYVVDYALNQLITLDTATGAQTVVGSAVPGGGETWTGLSNSPDGTLYGSASTCGASTLYTLDPNTGAATAVGPISNGACIIDIAINANGEMYGVEIVNDVLVQIDPATGAGTVIGPVGINANYAQGMSFDKDAGVLYWASYSSQGELRTIDVATGASTPVGAFPGGAEVDAFAVATGGGGDVPWLSEAPVSGTIAPLSSVQDVITFDAGVPEVTQPGNYYATLKIKNDTPYGTPGIPVTMTVVPPADWGKLQGTVTGLGYCDSNPAPLDGATVVVEGSSGMTWTLTTDPAGYYVIWVQETESPLTVTASMDQHQTLQVPGVVVVGSQTTTLDINLRLLEPCVGVAPASMAVTLTPGSSTMLPLTLSNMGAANLTFALQERPGGFIPPKISVVPTPLAPVSQPGSSSLAHRTAAPGAPVSHPTGPDAWLSGTAMPMGDVRYAHTQCPGDTNSFYIIAGVSNGTVINNAWRYDSDTGTWNTLAPIPTGSEGPTGVCYEDKIYVVGGAPAGTPTGDLYIYDIASDTWSTGAAMPRITWGAAAAAYEGKVYIVGGDNDFAGGGTSNEVDIYDIATDTWTTGSPMPTPRSTPGYVQLGEVLYVVGGWGDTAPGSNSNVTERYDMASDAWEVGPAFAIAKGDFALAATSQYLYAMGGDADGGSWFDSSNTVWRYDWTMWPAGAWEDTTDPLPTAVTANNGGFATDSLAGGEVWTSGGIDPSFAWTTQNVYRPSEPLWTPVPMDIPWLSESPVTGTVLADSSAVVDVTFDSITLTLGTYTGTLMVRTNDPVSPRIAIPVTLTIAQCDPVTGTAFTWAPTTPLEGEFAAFTATVAGGATPIAYEWNLGDGGTGSGANITHAYAVSGTYTVVLTTSNFCSEQVVRHDITVIAPPPVCNDVQIITVTRSISGCAVTFTPELTGTAPFTYLWTFGDGMTSTTGIPVHTYGASGTYNVTANVYNCVNGHAALNFSVTVTCGPVMHTIYLPLVYKTGAP